MIVAHSHKFLQHAKYLGNVTKPTEESLIALVLDKIYSTPKRRLQNTEKTLKMGVSPLKWKHSQRVKKSLFSRPLAGRARPEKKTRKNEITVVGNELQRKLRGNRKWGIFRAGFHWRFYSKADLKSFGYCPTDKENLLTLLSDPSVEVYLPAVSSLQDYEEENMNCECKW